MLTPALFKCLGDGVAGVKIVLILSLEEKDGRVGVIFVWFMVCYKGRIL